jgi:hypothetical protein
MWHGKPLRTGRFRTVCGVPGNILNGEVDIAAYYQRNLNFIHRERTLLS